MHIAVWDFNGVIVDDAAAHLAAYNAILAMFDRPPITDLARSRMLNSVPYIDSFLAVGIDLASFKARNAEIDHAYHAAYLQQPEAMQLRAGVIDLLDAVTERGGENVILTNTRRDVLNTQLDAFGLRHRFNWLSPDDDRLKTGFRLTKADRLRDYFARAIGSTTHGIMLGDSTEEPEVARALGLTSIAIGGGWFDDARLKAAQPDHFVPCLRQAVPIVRGLRFG